MRHYRLGLCCLLAGIFMTVANASAGGTFPEQFHSEYLIKKGPFTIGRAERSLTPLGNGQYRFESVTHPQGIAKFFINSTIIERTTLIMQPGGIRPLHYTYDNPGRKKNRRVELSFNWEHGTVTNTVDGDPWTMQIKPGALDKFVYQLAIMRDLNVETNKLVYQIADGGRLKTYEAVVKGREPVATTLGTFDSLIVERNDGKRITTLWCVEKLHFLPVKIAYEEDGIEYVGMINKLTGFQQ